MLWGSDVQMKGVELYSWQVGVEWRFSLHAGTNRSKSLREITNPKTAILSVGELQEQLDLLPAGEQVFWVNPDGRPFAYPLANVVCQLVERCERRGVTLTIGRPCEAA
jgi:hypothetical protein